MQQLKGSNCHACSRLDMDVLGKIKTAVYDVISVTSNMIVKHLRVGHSFISFMPLKTTQLDSLPTNVGKC